MSSKLKSDRPWTATEIRILRGLAQQGAGREHISRKLKRSTEAVVAQAAKLAIPMKERQIKRASAEVGAMPSPQPGGGKDARRR